MNDRSFKLSVKCICTNVSIVHGISVYSRVHFYELLLILIFTRIQKKCNIVSKILLIFEIFNKAFLKDQTIIANEVFGDF